MILQKSADALSPKQRMLWNAVRLLVPSETRWLYEGDRRLIGQLWIAERRLMYETILRVKPVHCFEIGTWKGGGSTYFTASALSQNGKGKLHTVEFDKAFFDEAKSNYSRHLPQLAKHVEFHLGDYREIYPPILRAIPRIDFLFLDGPEDGEQSLEQFKFFEPYLKPGSILMTHDWFTEKSRLTKPIIEQSDSWEIQTILTPPESVGFALATKK